MTTPSIKRKSANLAMKAVAGTHVRPLQVESPAFTDGDGIPQTYTDYGDGVSPALTWDNVPKDTRSFAVVVEDPDVRQRAPFVHWLIYNLPGEMRELPESIPPDSPLTEFGGARQGRTSNGTIGYFGPRPPTQDGAHHYHFQVFCLDSYVDLESGADREQLIKAMAGHVLAKGELVGTYEAEIS